VVQAGQDREGRMPGHDNKDQTLGTGELWTIAMELDSCDRTGGQVGQDRRDRIGG
jgi:hypothetical protein